MTKLMRRLTRDQRGITGLETAIILIAFVVVAAVFAYTVLSAGVFSAQKGQETIYGGLKQAAGSMELKGGVMGLNKVQGESIGTGDGTTTTFYISYAPILADSQTIYVAGTAKTETTHYTITDATGVVIFEAGSIPTSGQAITADYRAASTKVSKLVFVVSNAVGGEAIDMTAPSEGTGTPDGLPASSSTHKMVISYHDKNQQFNDLTWTKSQLGYGDSDDLLEAGEAFEITVNLRALTTQLDIDTDFTLDVKPQQGAAVVITRRTPNKIDQVMNLR